MSRELDLLACEFKNEPVTVIRTVINIYQTPIRSATTGLLRKIESECKRQKIPKVTLIALIHDK